MSQTNTQHPSLGDVIRRAGLPFLLFTSILMGLLLLSWYLLLPKLTTIDVGGTARGMTELKDYAYSLQGQVHEEERNRNAFVLPTRDTLYGSLVNQKRESRATLNLRSEIAKAATTVVPDNKQAIVFFGMQHKISENIFKVRGDVRSVGPRSMTVLGQFVEDLRKIPFVESVEGAKYVREEDPSIGFHSPFVIEIKLK